MGTDAYAVRLSAAPSLLCFADLSQAGPANLNCPLVLTTSQRSRGAGCCVHRRCGASSLW